MSEIVDKLRPIRPIAPAPPVAITLCAACRKPDCQHPDPVFAGITPHSEVQ